MRSYKFLWILSKYFVLCVTGIASHESFMVIFVFQFREIYAWSKIFDCVFSYKMKTWRCFHTLFVSIFLSKSFLQPILKSIPDFFVSMNIIEDFMLNTHTFIIYVSFRKVVFVHSIAPKLTWVNLLTWTLLKILMLIFWLRICQFFFYKKQHLSILGTNEITP
jgi:hypothetical protein